MWGWKLLKLFLNHTIIIIIVNSSLIPAGDLAMRDGIRLACVAGWIIMSVCIEAETCESVWRIGKRRFKVFHVFSTQFPRLCRQTLTHKDKFRQLRRLEFFELLHNVKELFCKLASLTLSKTQAKLTDLKLFLSNLVKVTLTASIIKRFYVFW